MRHLLRNLIVLLVGGTALVCVAALVARRPLSAWLAERWLSGRGIQSSIVTEELGLNGAVLQIRLGPPAHPDFTVQRLALAFAWDGLGPRVAAATLDRPRLRLRYNGHGLDFGQLQPLLGTSAAPTAAPPRHAPETAPGAAAPQPPPMTITFRDARLRIDAPAGALNLSGFGTFEDGRVHNLYVSADPALLRFRDAHAEINSAVLTKDPHDLVRVSVSGNISAGDRSLTGGDAEIEIAGLRWSNTKDGVRLSGRMTAQLTASAAQIPGTSVVGVSARLTADGDVATSGDANLRGSAHLDGVLPEGEATRKAKAIPLLGSDPKIRNALAKALEHVSLDAPSVQLLRSAEQTFVTLGAPVEIRGDGVLLALTARQGPLVHASNGIVEGAATAHLQGTDLPDIAVTLTNYRWQHASRAAAALEAMASVQAQFDFGPLQMAKLSASGAAHWSEDGLRVTLSDCAQFSAARVRSGHKTRARDVSARICERAPAPLLSTGVERWQLSGLWRDLSARLTTANAMLDSRRGDFVLTDRNGRLDGHVGVDAARLRDRAAARRFPAITLVGSAKIADNALSGRFGFSGAGRRTLGEARLKGTLTRGYADIRLAELDFAPGRLQPRDLSSLLAPIANAQGKVRGHAELAWNRRGLTSRGEITIAGLDFTSPAGRIEGVNGTIHLNSLMPLETAPDQTLSARKVAWVTPLNDVQATFRLVDGELSLADAHATLSQGKVSLAPIILRLGAGVPTRGAVTLDKVDVGEVIAASNLAQKVKATGRISGTVPFVYGPDGLTFADGHVATVGRASLSIAPSTWSGTDTTADGQSGAMRGFAYQALEHLAIDSLEGTVNSTPEGRLNLLLRIKGHNAPKQPKPAEVSLFALLHGSAFDKPVPLPAGTEVNLTLDTSLNFAELLAAYRKAWAESAGGKGP